MIQNGKKHVLLRYIAGEFVFSFVVVFLFFFFIFFINQILLMAEQILSKNVALGDVAKLIIYAIPSIIAFTFPFSALVGGLMAIGRLVGDNEILAIQSAGVPLRTIALPIFGIGILLGSLAFVSNDVLLPLGTMKFNILYREILYSNPALELESYSIKRYRDRVIATGNVEGNEIDGIVILDHDEKNNRRTINASMAHLGKDIDFRGVIRLILTDVVTITADQKRRDTYEYSTAERMEYNILLKDISLAVHSLTPREKSIRDIAAEIKIKKDQLKKRIDEKDAQVFIMRENLHNDYLDIVLSQDTNDPSQLNTRLKQITELEQREIRDRSLQMHLLEFHKKIALPAACVIFLVFAVPAGIMAPRSGKSIGFGIGLFVCIVYWGLLFAGQTLGIRSDFPPFLAIWGGNIVVLAVGIFLVVLRSRR